MKTISIKGSKRKLLDDILFFAKEIEAKTALDGFSGSGIVSAHLRKNGMQVSANDKMISANLYSRVFLEGFDKEKVEKEIKHINTLAGKAGWLSANYSGEKSRVIKGTGGQAQSRPRGFIVSNAMILDEARDYAETIVDPRTKNAVVFSIIMAMNKVFNGSTDQKSCLKEWTAPAKKKVSFDLPTLIVGKTGKTFSGNVLDLKETKYEFVYLDPPYTGGVLYDACYHLNDSVTSWTKPNLEHDYAVARPKNVCFKKNKISTGEFYSKKTAEKEFRKLLSMFAAKRIVLSYSDAPRNILTIDKLCEICSEIGTLTVKDRDHKICTQAASQNKISEELKEFFFVIDLTSSP